MNHLLKNELENIEERGFFGSPLGNCPNSFVCTLDLGEVGALCLLEGPALLLSTQSAGDGGRFMRLLMRAWAENATQLHGTIARQYSHVMRAFADAVSRALGTSCIFPMFHAVRCSPGLATRLSPKQRLKQAP